MQKIKTLDTSELIRKRDLLTQATITLKKEFFGIDLVIDQIIESISPWYFFPVMQERPVVVNLWGMTGVGKSDLLQRLIQLLNLNDKYFHFDMSEIADGQTSLNTEFSMAYQAMNKKPVIFAFDEFQLARSIDEETKENSQSKTRIVWDLIDSGKYKFIDYSYQIGYLHEFLYKASFLVRNGVKVKNGLVVQGEKLFLKEFDSENDGTSSSKGNFLRKRMFNRKPATLKSNRYEEGKLYFIDKEILDSIFELYSDKICRLIELRKHVLQFNERESIDFIKKVINHALCPKIIDLSKSLIFVIGNLDEAYKMSNDFNPDIDADSFYEESKKIDLSEIKAALKLRFRKEQISRLGNTHIIYPSLNSDAFKKIINKELKKIEFQWQKRFGIQLLFDDTVLKMVYEESVFPTQGVRPVLSTINQLIRSKLGYLAVEIIEQKLENTEEMIWLFEDGKFKIDFILKKEIKHSFKLQVNLQLSEKRKSKKDEIQSVVAVHESGHAIIASLLLNHIPEKIISITASSDLLGFTYTKFNEKLFAKNEIVKWVALYLGGIAAEEVVFGKDKISSGSGNDIEKATEFAAQMIRYSGMYKLPIMINVPDINTNNSFFDLAGEYNQYLEEIIKQGKQQAIDVLYENHNLLIAMANYLSDNSQMNKEMIQSFVEQYAKGTIPVSTISYRSVLKKKFQEIDTNNEIREDHSFMKNISLNKSLGK